VTYAQRGTLARELPQSLQMIRKNLPYSVTSLTPSGRRRDANWTATAGGGAHDAKE
jgi:hypothetical protein